LNSSDVLQWEANLWSALELKNFERYLAHTPKHLLGKAPPLGAYDARGGAREHGFGRLTRSHFSRGGAFDSAGESAPSEDRAVRLLRHLAQKLSPEGWAQMQRVLCAEEEEAPVEDELPEYVEGLPLNALGEKIGAKDYARAGWAHSGRGRQTVLHERPDARSRVARACRPHRSGTVRSTDGKI
jgi:hypothetical protein